MGRWKLTMPVEREGVIFWSLPYDCWWLLGITGGSQEPGKQMTSNSQSWSWYKSPPFGSGDRHLLSLRCKYRLIKKIYIYIYIFRHIQRSNYGFWAFSVNHVNPRHQWCTWLQRPKGSWCISAKDGSISQCIGYQGLEPEWRALGWYLKQIWLLLVDWIGEICGVFTWEGSSSSRISRQFMASLFDRFIVLVTMITVWCPFVVVIWKFVNMTLNNQHEAIPYGNV